MEYASALALFPAEWDYLRSALPRDLLSSNAFATKVSGDAKIAEQVSAAEELKILADLTSFCPLVVARLPLISVSDIAELTAAVTGRACDSVTLMQEVERTIQVDKTLSEMNDNGKNGLGALPPRFFRDQSSSVPPLSKNLFEREVSRYYQKRRWNRPTKMEEEL
jgi:aldehyde:ferredoxin oxidoreductase